MSKIVEKRRLAGKNEKRDVAPAPLVGVEAQGPGELPVPNVPDRPPDSPREQAPDEFLSFENKSAAVLFQIEKYIGGHPFPNWWIGAHSLLNENKKRNFLK